MADIHKAIGRWESANSKTVVQEALERLGAAVVGKRRGAPVYGLRRQNDVSQTSREALPPPAPSRVAVATAALDAAGIAPTDTVRNEFDPLRKAIRELGDTAAQWSDDHLQEQLYKRFGLDASIIQVRRARRTALPA